MGKRDRGADVPSTSSPAVSVKQRSFGKKKKQLRSSSEGGDEVKEPGQAHTVDDGNRASSFKKKRISNENSVPSIKHGKKERNTASEISSEGKKVSTEDSTGPNHGLTVEASGVQQQKKTGKKLRKVQRGGNKNKPRPAASDAEDGEAHLNQISGAGPSSASLNGMKTSPLPEPVGMQIYWNLSSVEASVREAASVALVKELIGAQRDYEEGGLGLEEKAAEAVLLGANKIEVEGLQNCAPAVDYALRRLVRGLASSRESARQGFALALTGVVGLLPCVKGSAIVKLIEKNLEVTSSMKGQESREALLGQLFAYGALIRAGRVIGEATIPEQQEFAKYITQELLLLAKKKSFLREPAVYLLIELGDRLAYGALEESMCAAPLFVECLQEEPNKMSPDTLLLALQLFEKLPIFVRQNCLLLPASGNLCDIFESTQLTILVPCLREASASHPRVHSIWQFLLELLLPKQLEKLEPSKITKKFKRKRDVKGFEDVNSMKARLASFWSIVVEQALLVSSHERKYLAMELLLLILPRLPAASCVFSILSSTFVRCLLDILASKDNLLYKSAQNCVVELCKWAEASEDEYRINVIIAIQLHSHGKFDVISKTHTVRGLMSTLNTKVGCMALVDSLATLFLRGSLDGESYGKPSVLDVAPKNIKHNMIEDECEEWGAVGSNEISEKESVNRQRMWVVDQMCLLCQQAHLESAERREVEKFVLKFLGLHALFKGRKMSAPLVVGEETFVLPEQSLSSQVRMLCISRLRALLATAQQTLDPSGKLKQNQQVTPPVRENVGYLIINFIEHVDTLSTVTLVHPLSEDSKESVLQLRSTLLEVILVLNKTDAVELKEKMQSMTTLIVYYLLELYLSPGVDLGAASEIVMCCKQAFGDLIKSKYEPDRMDEAESPVFMDVLVDLLLSLVVQPSAPIRAAAEQVFKSFCGDLTNSGLTDMLRIIKKNSTSARHNPVVDVDQSQDDDEEIVDVEERDDTLDDGLRNDVGSDAEDSSDLSEVEDEIDTEDGDSDGKVGNKGMEKIRRKSRPQKDGVKNVKAGSSSQKYLAMEADDDELELESSDMDDEAMFRIDAHLSQILKQRKKASSDGIEGNRDAQTQLTHFKFRVLALIECFLHKIPSSPLVLDILPCLLQVFVNSCSMDGNMQLADRIASILQSKVFKAKQYPKGSNADESKVKDLLRKALKLSSRSTNKKVRSVSQTACFWLLKVIHGNSAASEGQGDKDVENMVALALEDFFVQKKCRLPSSFFVECFTRHPWLGKSLVGPLLEKCNVTRSEFLQCEALHLLATVLRLKNGRKYKQTSELPPISIAGYLSPHFSALSKVILSLIRTPQAKAARRIEALQFCVSSLETFLVAFPGRPLKELIDLDLISAALKELATPPKGKLANLICRLQQLTN